MIHAHKNSFIFQQCFTKSRKECSKFFGNKNDASTFKIFEILLKITVNI
jgi:hypothetical protein